jgi:hypothetical protein
VGLERGPLSLVSTTEELLERKVADPVYKIEITAIGIRCADHSNPLYPTSGGRSVGIVRSRTKATELLLLDSAQSLFESWALMLWSKVANRCSFFQHVMQETFSWTMERCLLNSEKTRAREPNPIWTWTFMTGSCLTWNVIQFGKRGAKHTAVFSKFFFFYLGALWRLASEWVVLAPCHGMPSKLFLSDSLVQL